MGGEESPGRIPEVEDEEIHRVLRDADDPVLATSEIADQLPIGQRQTETRLKRLEDEGNVWSKKHAGNLLWWGQQTEYLWSHQVKENQDHGSDAETIGVEIIDWLDIDGEGEVIRRRRVAVNAVYRYLFREADSDKKVGKSDLLNLAWVANPAPSYADPESLWRNCVVTELTNAPYFRYDQSKGWVFNQFGQFLKNEYGSDVFWENWEATKQDLYTRFYGSFWKQVNTQLASSPGDPFILPHYDPDPKTFSERKHPVRMDELDGSELGFYISPQKDFWLTLDAESHCYFFIPSNMADLSAIEREKDSIQGQFDDRLTFSRTTINDLTYLVVKASRDMTLEPKPTTNQIPDNPAETFFDTDIEWLGSIAERLHAVFHDRLT